MDNAPVVTRLKRRECKLYPEGLLLFPRSNSNFKSTGASWVWVGGSRSSAASAAAASPPDDHSSSVIYVDIADSSSSCSYTLRKYSFSTNKTEARSKRTKGSQNRHSTGSESDSDSDCDCDYFCQTIQAQSTIHIYTHRLTGLLGIRSVFDWGALIIE